MIVSTFLSGLRAELSDETSKQFSDAELLGYLNTWYETIYNNLVTDESELVRTGTATITTEAGTETYATITDLWAPYRVWVPGYEPMAHENEAERMNYEQSDGTMRTGRPDTYYIEGTGIGFLPVPGGVYNISVKYFPVFTPLTATSADMPFNGMFTRQIAFGVMASAKNRAGLVSAIEVSLLQLHQDISMQIMRMRRKSTYQLSPGV